VGRVRVGGIVGCGIHAVIIGVEMGDAGRGWGSLAKPVFSLFSEVRVWGDGVVRCVVGEDVGCAYVR